MARLVISKAPGSLSKIAFLYVFSFVFLAQALLLLIAVIREVVTSPFVGDRLEQPLLFTVFETQFSVPLLTALMVLLLLYLTSTLLLYFAERKWLELILKIVTSILLDARKAAAGSLQKEVRIGAIATVRVSSILLATSTPAIISFLAFAVLIILNWKMAILIVVLGLVGAYLFLALGRQTKKISTDTAFDDDDEISVSVSESSSQQGAAEQRLEFVATLLQFKARSRFLANLLFAVLIVAFGAYVVVDLKSIDQGYILLVSSMLLYLIFNGLKVVSSKVVPLSRQYILVRNFIGLTGGKRCR